MSSFKMSKSAAMKVIQYSNEMYEELNGNTKMLNQNILAQFQTMKDPRATQKFTELMMALEKMLKDVGNTVEGINEYCEQVIRWLDTIEAY